MGDWIKIRNWDRWQTYRKDRLPPWIKIHRQLAENIDWVSLTDAQRGQLVSMWILAASRNGLLPASPVAIKKLCFLESEPDLEVFIGRGFLERVNVDVQTEQPECAIPTTCSRKNDKAGLLDKEKDKEIEEEEDKEGDAPTQADKPKLGVSSVDLSFPPALDNPEARSAIDEWIEYKRSRGQPYKKPSHLNKLLEQYVRDGPRGLVDAVNHSIACNYQGVFRPGGQNGTRGRPGPQIGPGQSYDPSTADIEGTF